MIFKYVAGTPELARFDYSRVNASAVDKTQKRIELAAEYFYTSNLVVQGAPFASLTKTQKLEIVAKYIEKIINDAAQRQTLNAKQSTANTSASAEFEAN